MAKTPWCQCMGKGTCIGCLIRGKVRELFGAQGEEYLMDHVGVKEDK